MHLFHFKINCFKYVSLIIRISIVQLILDCKISNDDQYLNSDNDSIEISALLSHNDLYPPPKRRVV